MFIPNDNWIGGHLGNHRLLELEMKDSLAKFIMRSAFLYIYMNTYSIYTYLRMYVLFVIKLMLPSLKKKKKLMLLTGLCISLWILEYLFYAQIGSLQNFSRGPFCRTCPFRRGPTL